MAARNLVMAAAGATTDKTYVDDVFSTYLYTGNGSTQTITNGIDLAGKGGLVWIKNRSGVTNHVLSDSVRGINNELCSNLTSGQTARADNFGSFNSSGFTLGAGAAGGSTNTNSSIYTSWTFREAPKFFDVVTLTANASGAATVNHSLGKTPGFVIVKSTGTSESWWCWHSTMSSTQYLSLHSTMAVATSSASISVDSSQVVFGTNWLTSNTSYVAYLFAHDTESDGLIRCGSFTTDGSGNATVSLGWEPQWVMVKSSSAVGSWIIVDAMRGMPVGGSDFQLYPNSSSSEPAGTTLDPNAEGFKATTLATTTTYIYIAIRRPNKPPTAGTQVFSPILSSAATGTALTTSFPVDLQIFGLRTGTTNKGQTVDRLRGVSSTAAESGLQLLTHSTAAETSGSIPTRGWDNTGFKMPSSYGGAGMLFWNFRRAPGVFDVVCYTGAGGQLVSHNLGVPPELRIIKKRGATSNWAVIYGLEKSTVILNDKLVGSLNATAALSASTPTATPPNPSTKFSVYYVTPSYIDDSGATYVAYLFATFPGISKVFSYTGDGGSQTINCGFTTGARFVLIKRTDSTGDWYVWDSARGISADTDSHLSLNTTAAEVSTDDSIDPNNSGFIVNQLAATNINVTSATYIGLAFA